MQQFLIGSMYYYGYDEQPYTCLFENSDVVLFEYPYQGYKRHALMQRKEMKAAEWSSSKQVRKGTLSSLFGALVKQTEETGDYQHRTDKGSYLSSTIEEYKHLTGQGLAGENDN